MIFLNNIGSFDSIDEVWKAYPYGGKEGDYVTINGKIVAWNKYTNRWSEYDNILNSAIPQNAYFFQFDHPNGEGAGLFGWCWFSLNKAENRRQIDFVFLQNMGQTTYGATITAGYDDESATMDDIKAWTIEQIAALWLNDEVPEGSAWSFHSSRSTNINQITDAIEELAPVIFDCTAIGITSLATSTSLSVEEIETATGLCAEAIASKVAGKVPWIVKYYGSGNYRDFVSNYVVTDVRNTPTAVTTITFADRNADTTIYRLKIGLTFSDGVLQGGSFSQIDSLIATKSYVEKALAQIQTEQLYIYAQMGSDADGYPLTVTMDGDALARDIEYYLHEGIDSVHMYQWVIIVADEEGHFLEHAVLHVQNDGNDYVRFYFTSQYSGLKYTIIVSTVGDSTYGNITIETSSGGDTVVSASSFQWTEVN